MTTGLKLVDTRRLDARADHAHSLQFLLTQRECLLSHGMTFSRCR